MCGICWYVFSTGAGVSNLQQQSNEVGANLRSTREELNRAREAFEGSKRITVEIKQSNQAIGDAITKSRELNQSSQSLAGEGKRILQEVRSGSQTRD